MDALQATVFFLVLLISCEINGAEDEEWKTATATYSKETDGSIITGKFFFLAVVSKLSSCSLCFIRMLHIYKILKL